MKKLIAIPKQDEYGLYLSENGKLIDLIGIAYNEVSIYKYAEFLKLPCEIVNTCQP